MDFQELLKLALALPEQDRAWLASKLYASVDEDPLLTEDERAHLERLASGFDPQSDVPIIR